jgi:acetoin utilization deacetylase AcuC-like enzyme
MITVYTDAHRTHDPAYEIYDGVPTAYAEAAARADNIVAAVREQNIGPVRAPRQFPLRHIHAVHQKQYVDFVHSRSAPLGPDELLYPSYYMSDTYAPIVAGTYSAARSAVDSALTGADLVLHGEPVVYSLCRPPGHHASDHRLGGYCYFNNAAVAANYLSAHGRVTILDIDFHHGNGTQDAFYDRDDVQYISIHADPHDRYPYSSGFASETGRGPGLGSTVNLPLPIGTTAVQYMRSLRRALVAVQQFAPDYLIVSAGFDTFVDDPIGGFTLAQGDYAPIAAQIQAVGLPTLIVQEGGYCVEQLGNLVTEFLSGFSPERATT